MIRQIGDVSPSDDRHHVMLTIAFEADVLQHDHLVIAINLGKCRGENLYWIGQIAREELRTSAGDSPWRLDESLAKRVVSGPSNERSNCFFRVCLRGPGWN